MLPDQIKTKHARVFDAKRTSSHSWSRYTCASILHSTVRSTSPTVLQDLVWQDSVWQDFDAAE